MVYIRFGTALTLADCLNNRFPLINEGTAPPRARPRPSPLTTLQYPLSTSTKCLVPLAGPAMGECVIYKGPTSIANSRRREFFTLFAFQVPEISVLKCVSK